MQRRRHPIAWTALIIAAVGSAIIVNNNTGAVSKPCRSSLPRGGTAARNSVATWGIIGNDAELTGRERAAGFDAKVISLSWAQAEPQDGVFSSAYLDEKVAEACALDRAGMRVILDWGIQYTPQWIHALPNSYLVDQYAEPWTTSTDPLQATGDSDADLIFNPILRRLAQRYIEVVARRLGAHIAAIRIGGGRNNELAYPSADTPLHQNTYWAYGYWAQLHCPVPGWKPGDPSRHGEATRFLAWYINSLTDYERWQETTLGRYYAGPMLLLFPSWGLRPGQAAQAVSDDLDDRTTAESNGETQLGLDFAGEVAAIDSRRVWVETTWSDARAGNDSSASPVDWTPIHYLRSLVARQPDRPQLWAENTGQGSAEDLAFATTQAERYGASGFVWFDEAQLFKGDFATLDDLASVIRAPP